MVRITSKEHDHRVILRLEGSLRGPWVAELERVWQVNQRLGKDVCVDLEDVQYVDGSGKALLTRMFQNGTALSASGVLMKAVVQEILETGTSSVQQQENAAARCCVASKK